MASLRNLAVAILRRHGDRNIAAARRPYARDATASCHSLASQAQQPDNPALAEILSVVRLQHGSPQQRPPGDTLFVRKLDHLGRWLRHLLAKLALADRVPIVVFADESGLVKPGTI